MTRIAVADDERLQRDLLCDALSGPDVELAQASNGAELLALVIDHGPFDLIVTDLVMPGMSGLQAVTALRHAHIATPCVFVTGSSEELVFTQVEQLTHARVLKKPFLVSELRTCVAELVAPPLGR